MNDSQFTSTNTVLTLRKKDPREGAEAEEDPEGHIHRDEAETGTELIGVTGWAVGNQGLIIKEKEDGARVKAAALIKGRISGHSNVRRGFGSSLFHSLSDQLIDDRLRMAINCLQSEEPVKQTNNLILPDHHHHQRD